MQQKPLNQRASHFTLGHTSDHLGSIYKKDYIKKQSEPGQKSQSLAPNRGGTMQNNNNSSFATTNHALFRNWGDIEKAALNPDKLKELKGHHFHLGSYYPEDLYTSNKHFHNKKELTSDALKNMEESKIKMRAHFHDFKEQPFTNFKSTYNKEFLGEGGEVVERVKNENGKNTIVFGNHYLPKVTTNNADYVKKNSTPNEIKNSLQQSSSLVLGDKSESMKTINQVYFEEKQIVKNQLPEETMKELRNGHFTLGAAPANYATECNANYQAFASSKVQSMPPGFNTGNWMPQNARFNPQTTNKRELSVRPVQPFSRAGPSVKGGFKIGNQGSSYETQFQNNFKNRSSNFDGITKAPGKDNVVIGENKTDYYTEHRHSFKERDLNATRKQVDYAAKSKEDHFQIGGQGRDAKLTVYQDEFRQDQQNKSRLFHKQNL